jgi:transposase
LTKDEDYLWGRGQPWSPTRPAPWNFQAGHPQNKGNRRGPAYAYNVKALRDQEQQLAQQAERNSRASSISSVARERLNPARNE